MKYITIVALIPTLFLASEIVLLLFLNKHTTYMLLLLLFLFCNDNINCFLLSVFIVRSTIIIFILEIPFCICLFNNLLLINGSYKVFMIHFCIYFYFLYILIFFTVQLYCVFLVVQVGCTHKPMLSLTIK